MLSLAESTRMFRSCRTAGSFSLASFVLRRVMAPCRAAMFRALWYQA